MGSRTIAGNVLRVLVVCGSLLSATVFAHDMFYRRDVLRVESDRLQVRTVDASTKKEEAVTFSVTRDTKVKRGDRVVPFSDAAISSGERVVVVVNHDATVKNVATEVRLAAK